MSKIKDYSTTFIPLFFLLKWVKEATIPPQAKGL